MKKSLDLLEGNIFRSLLKLSLPLMGTAFVQMCYSLVDLMWLGRLSTGASSSSRNLLLFCMDSPGYNTYCSYRTFCRFISGLWQK